MLTHKLLQHSSCARHLLTPQPYDQLMPISKLLPFTMHSSLPRRLGVAAAIKNVALAAHHDALLDPPLGLLPAVLRPLMSGADAYSEAETEALPDELQLLEPDAKRETDPTVLATHLETLLALTGTRREREQLRAKGVYYVVRECHLAVEDEIVREACDRVVQVLMRDEEGEEPAREREASDRREHEQKREQPAPGGHQDAGGMVQGVTESDEDNEIVDVF